MKIQSFTQLEAWRVSHGLVLEIYKFTDNFPTGERFGLTNQLRRASVSITSNIAEGFSRRTSIDKNRFYNTSLGSIAEVQNQILIARDLGYISQSSFKMMADKSVGARKLVYGLIRSSQTKI